MEKTKFGELEIHRTEKAEPFHCDRCNADKKAKLKATLKKPDGTTVTVCNGCYGWMLANRD